MLHDVLRWLDYGIELQYMKFLLLLTIVYFIVAKVIDEINLIRHNIKAISFVMSLLFSYFAFSFIQDKSLIILISYGLASYLIYKGFLVPGVTFFYFIHSNVMDYSNIEILIIITLLTFVNVKWLEKNYSLLAKRHISWLKRFKIILWSFTVNFTIFLGHWFVKNGFIGFYTWNKLFEVLALPSLMVTSLFWINELVFFISAGIGVRWRVLKNLDSEIKRLEGELREIDKKIEEEEIKYREHPEERYVIEKRLEFLKKLREDIKNQLNTNKAELKKKIID